MGNRRGLALLPLLVAGMAAAQTPELPASIRVDIPRQAPVVLLNADWKESRASARGGAMVLDLSMTLSLRNQAPGKIRGITLLVEAQKVTPGGKASVTVSGLNAASAETFPVRMDLRLIRPLVRGETPLVEVRVDGILFDDLSFWGPDTLNSRRTMTVWEFEARRDREYLRGVLETKGPQGLRDAMLANLDRQASRRTLDVRVARGGRATAAAPEREAKLAFLDLASSPIQPVSASARLAGHEARSSEFRVLNRSGRPIRYFEVGCILRDREGREFLVGSIPAAESPGQLAPGARGLLRQASSLAYSDPRGQPVPIESLTGFIRLVEYEDGGIWVPSRAEVEQPALRRSLGLSPEEERLTELYRKRGIDALVEQLRRF